MISKKSLLFSIISSSFLFTHVAHARVIAHNQGGSTYIYPAPTNPFYLKGLMGYSQMKIEDITNTTGTGNISRATPGLKERKQRIFDVGVGFGYSWRANFNIPLRTEIVFTRWRKVKYDANPTFIPAAGFSITDERVFSVIKSRSLMLNIFYDIGTWRRWTPYIGGGGGYVKNRVEADSELTTGANHTKSLANWYGFGWNIGAGAYYRINPRVLFGIGYRYFQLGEVKWRKLVGNSGKASSLASHNVQINEVRASLAYTF